MRKARVPSTIFTSLALLAAPATAQSWPEGCFTRQYGADHLASQPAQIVDRIALRLRHDENGTNFRLIVRLAAQGHAGADGFGGMVMSEEGFCTDGQPCYVYCDGGGFTLSAAHDDSIDITTTYMRIARGDACDGTSEVSDLSEGPGQSTTYRLFRSRDVLCGR
ncbi:MAG: hypothetical protein KDK12_17330 [Rhodobacteraceae bacterium]|nr:hypothetical protein [Paracoccaceae bacterium]